ncbi:hypothetical protein DFJ58DRAFT_844123 [Suillus subalutaceus]|uniref:uncharacterized protein n=1 Tax=Suillus subalutaceus TaxID=48586 RepID=UPI001B86B4A2|nr:uncharacterized protein DFJ58DRAFT_844123 [Suillus subalutaceus]KAG1844048.1 hypothetical protein DFJ58DRAFT_844123 [Suillus subalutaceus]
MSRQHPQPYKRPEQGGCEEINKDETVEVHIRANFWAVGFAIGGLQFFRMAGDLKWNLHPQVGNGTTTSSDPTTRYRISSSSLSKSQIIAPTLKKLRVSAARAPSDMVANDVVTSRESTSRAFELNAQMLPDVPRDTAHFQTFVHRARTPAAFEVRVASVHDTVPFPKMGENVSGRAFDEHSAGRVLGVPGAAIDEGYLSIPRVNGSAWLNIYDDGVLRARRFTWTMG